MRLDFAVRRARRLSLTSLIDVIFLLLLFFMLSSTFTRFGEIELAAGRGGSGAAQERPDVLISLSKDSWKINGLSFDIDSVGEELKRLAAAGGKSAVILLRGDMTSQELVSAIETVRGAADLKLAVVR